MGVGGVGGGVGGGWVGVISENSGFIYYSGSFPKCNPFIFVSDPMHIKSNKDPLNFSWSNVSQKAKNIENTLRMGVLGNFGFICIQNVILIFPNM